MPMFFRATLDVMLPPYYAIAYADAICCRHAIAAADYDARRAYYGSCYGAVYAGLCCQHGAKSDMLLLLLLLVVMPRRRHTLFSPDGLMPCCYVTSRCCRYAAVFLHFFAFERIDDDFFRFRAAILLMFSLITLAALANSEGEIKNTTHISQYTAHDKAYRLPLSHYVDVTPYACR